MRRDPLTSFVTATLFFGCVFFAAIVFKLIGHVYFLWSRHQSVPQDSEGLLRLCLWLLVCALGSGGAVSLSRRLLHTQSLKLRNLVTGGLVGTCYALSCMLLFGANMPLAPMLGLGLFTQLGIWYAVSSALNQALK